jgi:hypothetical protein
VVRLGLVYSSLRLLFPILCNLTHAQIRYLRLLESLLTLIRGVGAHTATVAPTAVDSKAVCHRRGAGNQNLTVIF